MAYETKTKQIFDQATGSTNKTRLNDIIAIGNVVDTNDPLQLGRVRVMVPAWGDSWDHNVDTMPWCMFVTPFGGQTKTGTRGANDDETVGGVAYGMWALPNVGAQAVVMSLDDKHIQRLYIGCVFDLNTTHTMPHGRWISDDHPELKDTKPPTGPYGPYSSREQLIQPLASNLQKAFPAVEVSGKKYAHEWNTRAADFSVSRVDVSQLEQSFSKVQDDPGQGYNTSRVNPIERANGANLDSHTYSITSPGFHSISMDDRAENCRVRIRTTAGTQILLDDTNERIYISTAQGNNWIEMDQCGNIDVYSSSRVSIHAAEDINLTADGSIRMVAGEGIHLNAGTDIRDTAAESIHTHAGKDIKHHAAGGDIRLQSGKDVHVTSGNNLLLQSTAKSNIFAGADLLLTSSAGIGLSAGGNILNTGAQIHLNGPAASKAEKSVAAEEQPAFSPNRIPQHEPWARGLTKKDDKTDPEFDYNDPNVGKMERGKLITRGKYWRR